MVCFFKSFHPRKVTMPLEYKGLHEVNEKIENVED